MLWGCSAAETGALHKIDGIMKKEHSVETLKQRLKLSARNLKLGHKWVHMDSDPKHNAETVTKCMYFSRYMAGCSISLLCLQVSVLWLYF